jgi:hypothetical protein
MTAKRPKSDVRKRQAQIAVRLLPEEDELVRELAARQGHGSAAEVVRRALTDYLAAASA